MSDPFRDELSAALTRTRRLEEEVERLREELKVKSPELAARGALDRLDAVPHGEALALAAVVDAPLAVVDTSEADAAVLAPAPDEKGLPPIVLLPPRVDPQAQELPVPARIVFTVGNFIGIVVVVFVLGFVAALVIFR